VKRNTRRGQKTFSFSSNIFAMGGGTKGAKGVKGVKALTLRVTECWVIRNPFRLNCRDIAFAMFWLIINKITKHRKAMSLQFGES